MHKYILVQYFCNAYFKIYYSQINYYARISKNIINKKGNLVSSDTNNIYLTISIFLRTFLTISIFLRTFLLI